MKKIMRASALALFGSILMIRPGLAADTPSYPPLTKSLHVEQVPGKPIYYSIGNPGIPDKSNEGNTSNAGFVITSDGVVVFDALGTPSLGWALL